MVRPEALQWAMDRLGLTQRELADALGLHPNTVWKWCNKGAPLYMAYAIPGLLLARWKVSDAEEYLEAAETYLFRQGDLLEGLHPKGEDNNGSKGLGAQ